MPLALAATASCPATLRAWSGADGVTSCLIAAFDCFAAATIGMQCTFDCSYLLYNII